MADVRYRFAERCKELRAKTGLNQDDFAAKANIDRSYYASIETGARNVSLKKLEQIANGFEISLEELMKGV